VGSWQGRQWRLIQHRRQCFLHGRGGNRSVAAGVAGEIGASWAGSINNGLASIANNGMGPQYLAAQQNAIFGMTGSKNTAATLSAFGGVQSFSAQDNASMLSVLSSNPFLWTRRSGTQASNNLIGKNGFLNTVTGMNPTMGAAGAAQFANVLSSGPMLPICSGWLVLVVAY